MEIKWFNEKKQKGTATFYESNLTLNAVAKIPFEKCEHVRVGVDSSGSLLLKPISFDDYNKGLIPKEECYPIVTHSSYARISSTSLLSQIANAFNRQFSKEPTRFETIYEEKEGILIIPLNKERSK